MRRSRPAPLGRLALLLILTGLLLTLAGMTYVMFVRWRVDSTSALAAEGAAADAVGRLRLVVALLLLAVLSIIAFVVGTCVVISMGRRLAARRLGDRPTDYVDAWSRYRLSQADLDAADRMLGPRPDRDKPADSGDNSGTSDHDDPPER